jgi:hypothetical protein
VGNILCVFVKIPFDFLYALCTPSGILAEQVLLSAAPNLHCLTAEFRGHNDFDRIIVGSIGSDLTFGEDLLNTGHCGLQLLGSPVSVVALRDKYRSLKSKPH